LICLNQDLRDIKVLQDMYLHSVKDPKIKVY
jgi:hypothetical protein